MNIIITLMKYFALLLSWGQWQEATCQPWYPQWLMVIFQDSLCPSKVQHINTYIYVCVYHVQMFCDPGGLRTFRKGLSLQKIIPDVTSTRMHSEMCWVCFVGRCGAETRASNGRRDGGHAEGGNLRVSHRDRLHYSAGYSQHLCVCGLWWRSRCPVSDDIWNV